MVCHFKKYEFNLKNKTCAFFSWYHSNCRKKSRQKTKQGNTRKSKDYMPFHAEV